MSIKILFVLPAKEEQDNILPYFKVRKDVEWQVATILNEVIPTAIERCYFCPHCIFIDVREYWPAFSGLIDDLKSFFAKSGIILVTRFHRRFAKERPEDFDENDVDIILEHTEQDWEKVLRKVLELKDARRERWT